MQMDAADVLVCWMLGLDAGLKSGKKCSCLLPASEQWDVEDAVGRWW